MADNEFGLGDAVGEVIGQQNQDTASQIRNSVQDAVTSNPDQEAKYQSLAKFTNVPVDTVRAQPAAMEQRAAVSNIDADEITTKSPTTAKFFTDQNKAKLAVDDIANMRDLEDHVSQTGLLGGLVNSFSLSAYNTFEGAKALYGDKTGDTAMAQDAIKNIQDAGLAQEQTVPQIDNTLGRWTYGAVQGLVNSAPILASAFVTGPVGPIALFGAQGGASGYGKYRARGGTEGEAALGGATEAAINVATSFMPIKYLSDKMGKAGAGEFLTNLLIRDGLSMEAQTIATSAVDTAIANPDKSWKDWAHELPGAMGEAAVSALTFASAFGSINAAKVRMSGSAGKVEAAAQGTEAIQRINDVATQSKLRARDPEAFKQFMADATSRGPVQDLFVSASDLAQAGIDPIALGKAVPAVNDQIQTALMAGTDIKIPVADFATHLAGTELGQSMIDHLKTDPNGFSRAQADEYMSNEGENLKAEVEKVLAEKQGDETFKASRQAVHDNILGQLRETNRFTDDVNAPYASLLSNFYSVQAARTGMTPEAMFEKFPIKVASDSPASTKQLGSEVNQDNIINIVDNGEGTVDIKQGEKSVGEIKYTEENNVVRIKRADISDSGKGIGTKAYAQFIDAQLAKGKTIGSDADVSKAAQRVYEKLADQGYEVSKSENLRLMPGYRLTTVSREESQRQQRTWPLVYKDGVRTWKPGSNNLIGDPVYTVTGKKELNQANINKTETPEFKKWFGKSKVIDEDGKPLVVYHGGRADIEQFNAPDGKYKTGIFFTNDRGVADAFGKGGDTYPVYLNFKKPFIVDAKQEEYSNIAKPKEMKNWATTETVDTDLIAEWAFKKGYDGVIVKNVLEGRGNEYSDVYIASKPGQIKSIDNTGTYNLNDPRIKYQGDATRRGSFNTETNVITLFKSADLSTFLHESGHFFLETMNKISLMENAPPELRADMDATLKWLGVDGLEDWNSRDLEQQRDAHEQFARGFETFLFEGKSPNKEMHGVFQRFASWLVNIYRNKGALNAELSDEMRGVFDRMLATRDEIRDAEIARSYEPFFKTAEEAGMTPEEWREYQELGIDATQDAITKLESRTLRDMKWLSNAKGRELKLLQKKAAAKRNTIRRETTDEVMSEPVYQVQTFLKRGIDPVSGEKVEGGFKLSIPEIEALYGDTPAYRAITEKLGYGKYGMLGEENGVHPDQVADMFGFSSGDEMIRSILQAEPAKEKIQGLTDQRMLEKYGDITSPDALSRAADEAIHNEVRTKFVAAEMNALQKAIGGKKILAEAAKKFAGAMIDRAKIRDLKPSLYGAAENKAARNADMLRKKGDLKGAATEKRNQLINMYATKATHEAQEFVEKGLRYLGKFEKDTTRKAIGTEHIAQIDAMLERFDLKKRSLKAIDERKQTLAEWAKVQEDEIGVLPDIDPAILNEANRKNYKDMSVSEMRGLIDAVKQVDHLGRLETKLLTAHNQATFQATVNGLITSIQEHAGDRVADNRTRANVADRVSRIFKGYLASHRKMASLARELDGFKDAGPMWETFIRTMNEAGDKEAVMRADATKDVATLLDPMLKAGGKMGGKGLYFESVGRSLNREERIGIALNMGNEGNIQRLLGGEGWTIDQVRPITDTLTKADWDFVQGVWDHFESYRPLIGAKEMRVYGKQPNWVDPSPVFTPHGEYKGGYYPIKYDPRQSVRAEQHNEAELAKQQMRGAYTSATTRRSFTKARVDEVTGRPLLYSMDGLYSGLNEVIHDLSWHEWLIDANRLLRNKGLDGAIRNRYGAEFVGQFKGAVKDIAGGEIVNSDALDRAVNHLRKGVTTSGLGFNIMNSMINVVGLTQSYVRIGPKWVGLGIGEWAANPKGFVENIHNKSDFMRLRAQTQQREINEIRNQVNGKSAVRQAYDRVAFLPMELTQLMVDAPSWWGAYQKALAEDHIESRAVALADQAVIDAQGNGATKDLAAIQRGGQTGKLLTTFYGFFSTTYNLAVESTKKTNFSDPKQVMKLGHDYMALMIVPAVLSSILKSAITNGMDEIEDVHKISKILANDLVSYMMGTMVGLREFTLPVQKMLGINSYNTAYGGPASLRFMNETDKLAQQVNQGELDAALRRSAVNLGGILFHLPGTQVNRTIDGITAIAEGKTKNPLAIVTGGPKD